MVAHVESALGGHEKRIYVNWWLVNSTLVSLMKWIVVKWYLDQILVSLRRVHSGKSSSNGCGGCMPIVMKSENVLNSRCLVIYL